MKNNQVVGSCAIVKRCKQNSIQTAVNIFKVKEAWDGRTNSLGYSLNETVRAVKRNKFMRLQPQKNEAQRYSGIWDLQPIDLELVCSSRTVRFAGMYYIRQMFFLLSITSVVFLFFGLIKPWLLLWWEDTQNRRKVIRVYGSVAVIFYLIYWGLSFIPIV